MGAEPIAEVLLELGILLGLVYLAAGLLERLRIPSILGALFVAMAAHYTPLGARLLSPELHPSVDLLAELGVMFLLFFIGLQIDLSEMRRLSTDIVWCTVLNTTIPFLLGAALMLSLGNDWILACVVGLTMMPTAEAVIVPILDEFGLVGSRVGQFIVGVGTLDDVIEVFLVSVVSVWIGRATASAAAGSALDGNALGILAWAGGVVGLALATHRWILPWVAGWLQPRLRSLMLLCAVVLFTLSGLCEYGRLGAVVGAITSGMLMRPVFGRLGATGQQAGHAIQAVSYGFLGPIFFLWVGLSADLRAMVQAPTLAILLFLAAFVGKLIGVLLMVPMKRLSLREGWTIGIGLNARLTTEIIVAQVLLDAGLITVDLFTALVAAASVSTVTVPLVFSIVVRRWGDALRAVSAACDDPTHATASQP
jgi:Ca2+-transporting ATPase